MTMTHLDHHAIVSARPLFRGPFGWDFVLRGFNPDADRVEAMLEPLHLEPPVLLLTAEAERQLRVGLGPVDMDIRWMAWLSERNELRLWRSWTGNEIYRARFDRTPAGLTLSDLTVEMSPDRYHPSPREPAQFIQTLRHVITTLTSR